MSYFGLLRSYEHFLFPYTPSCEPRLSAGGSLFLASYRQGDTGRLLGVRIAAERGVNERVNEEGIVRMVHRSPRTSSRRIARRLRVPHMRVWRTLHA